MNWYTNAYTPTLRGTLAEIWAVSRAIWRDYRDVCRARRRARLNSTRRSRAAFTTPTAGSGPRWFGDVLFVTALCAAATLLMLYSVGALPSLWAWLVRTLANLGGVQ